MRSFEFEMHAIRHIPAIGCDALALDGLGEADVEAILAPKP
jgi:hypothetical protein